MPASEILVTVPSDSRFVALTRVMGASLAAELDFSIDDIEELRVGVDELVSALLELTPATEESLELRFRLDGDTIEVTGRAPTETDAGTVVDPLSTRILEAVADEYRLGAGEVMLRKRRHPS